MSTATTRRQFVISRRHNGIRMSPEEFDSCEDFDELYSYELINGVLIVNAAPSRFETDPNEELGRWIRNFQELNPGIVNKTLYEHYIYTDNSRRRADRLIWVGYGEAFDLDKDLPTIAVEFVSKRRRDQLRDYVDKRDEYLALGIAEYWVINRFDRTLNAFRRSAIGYETQIVGDQETYRPTLIPGFELPLGKLLDVCNDWKKR
ncbi:MAG: Uma2 family endonuclease [Planctomycetaceae bacterium]|nr:Uma2 family endonuclease [Planctomycetaceae bacterium]